MRAGRMDRRIYFQSPTPEERQGLFRYYLKKVRCNLPPESKEPSDAAPVSAADNVIDLDELAMLTANYSPAEIAGVVNEAALIANRQAMPDSLQRNSSNKHSIGFRSV